MASFYQLGDTGYTGVNDAERGDAGFRVQDYALRRAAGYTEKDAAPAPDHLAQLQDTRLRAAGAHLQRDPRSAAVAQLTARFLSRENTEYLARELGRAGVPAATAQGLMPRWMNAFAARIKHEVFRENGAANVAAQLVTANREFVADRVAFFESHPHAFGLAEDPAKYLLGEWRSDHWAANRALSEKNVGNPRPQPDRGADLYRVMQERADRRHPTARLRPTQHTEVHMTAEPDGANPRVGAHFARSMHTSQVRSAAAARTARTLRDQYRGFQLKPE